MTLSGSSGRGLATATQQLRPHNSYGHSQHTDNPLYPQSPVPSLFIMLKPHQLAFSPTHPPHADIPRWHLRQAGRAAGGLLGGILGLCLSIFLPPLCGGRQGNVCLACL